MKSSLIIFHYAYRLPQIILITLVKAYRLLLSPCLGSACRFEPTCSVYSLQALQDHGALLGTYLTLHRLLRCQPWCNGGCDPVPPRKASAKCGPRSLFSDLVTPVTPTPLSSQKKSS